MALRWKVFHSWLKNDLMKISARNARFGLRKRGLNTCGSLVILRKRLYSYKVVILLPTLLQDCLVLRCNRNMPSDGFGLKPSWNPSSRLHLQIFAKLELVLLLNHIVRMNSIQSFIFRSITRLIWYLEKNSFLLDHATYC